MKYAESEAEVFSFLKWLSFNLELNTNWSEEVMFEILNSNLLLLLHYVIFKFQTFYHPKSNGNTAVID